jgi:hypothetical protein
MRSGGIRLALPTAFLDDDDGKACSSEVSSSMGWIGATLRCSQQGRKSGQQQALFSDAGGGGLESDLVFLLRPEVAIEAATQSHVGSSFQQPFGT